MHVFRFALFSILISSCTVWAQTNGMTRYHNSALQVFGNGSWVSLDQGSTGASCTTGGQLRYNSTASRAEFCNGVTWRSLDSGVTSAGSGSAGMTRYAGNQYQFHNGTNWIVSGVAPLHRWKFDETTGTNVVDVGAPQINGTFSGAANVTSEPNGVVDTGLVFDGTDDLVTIPNTGSVFLSVPFTWSMWVKFDNVTAHMYMLRMAHSAAPWSGYYLRMDGTAADKITFTTVNSAGTGFNTISDVTVNADTWYHVAVTVNSSYQARIYVDGVLQTDSDTPGSLYAADGSLILGGNNGSVNQLDGRLDDVRFYSRDLTASEINGIYLESAQSPTYVAHSTLLSSSGNTFTLNKPAGLQEGDILLAWINKNNASVTSPPANSGWTALSTYTYDSYTVHNFYKIATVADAAAANFTFRFGTASGDAYGILAAYRNVSPYTPMAFNTTNNSTGTTVTNLGGTTSYNYCRVIGIASGVGNPTLPAGFTNRQTGTWATRMSDREYATAGSVSDFTSTIASGFWGSDVYALNPANGPPVTPIRVVQTSPKFTNASVDTSSGSFDNLPATGNTIVVTVAIWNSTGPVDITGVTDNQGNTYQLAAKRAGGIGNAVTAIYYASNISSPSGSFTITVDGSQGAGNYWVWNASEVTGLSASPLDQTATAAGTTTGDANVGPTATTTQANEIVFAAAVDSTTDTNININVPVGFTQIGVQQDSNAIVGYSGVYKTVTSTGTQSVSWIHDNASQVEWAAVIATFK